MENHPDLVREMQRIVGTVQQIGETQISITEMLGKISNQLMQLAEMIRILSDQQSEVAMSNYRTELAAHVAAIPELASIYKYLIDKTNTDKKARG